jgi:hypothetical protein
MQVGYSDGLSVACASTVVHTGHCCVCFSMRNPPDHFSYLTTLTTSPSTLLKSINCPGDPLVQDLPSMSNINKILSRRVVRA